MKKHLHSTILFLTLALLLVAGCSSQTETPAASVMIDNVAGPATGAYATAIPAPTFILPATATPTPTAAPSPTPTLVVAPTSSPAAGPQATATATGATIVTTEAEANELAQIALAQQQDVSIEDVQVDFQPDVMVLSGYTTMGFFRIKVTLFVAVTPIDGAPEVTITDIYVNEKPATGFLRTQIESMIEPHLAQLAVVEKSFYVESVTITDDEMTITGHYR